MRQFIASLCVVLSLCGLSHAGVAGNFFGLNGSTLYSIDRGTGAITSVGTVGSGPITVAGVFGSTTFYGMDSIGNLFSFAQSTPGTTTSIGDTGIHSTDGYQVLGMTHYNSKLWVVAGNSPSFTTFRLYSVNISTAARTNVGNWTAGDGHTISADTSTGYLYSNDNNGGWFKTNSTNAATTTISTGNTAMGPMAKDGTNAAFRGYASGGSGWSAITESTGAVTNVSSTSNLGWTCLTAN